MIKNLRKAVSIVLAGTALFACCLVEAEWSGTAVKRTTAYTNAALTQRNGVEYVDKGDTVTVLAEQGNAYYVRYPLSRGGYKERWVNKDIFGSTAASTPIANAAAKAVQAAVNTQQNYQAWSGVMNSRATAYTDANLTQRNGVEYADKGDNVTVLGESSKAYYVRYPLSRGGTKDRWVAKSSVSRTGGSGAIANAAVSAAKAAVTQAQASYQQWQGYAPNKLTAYTNAALTTRSGIEYVGAGDTVTVLNESGNAYYVRYPLTRGGTKDRWVSKSGIQKVDNRSNTLSTAASQQATTQAAAQAVTRSSSYVPWSGVMNRRATAYTDENLTRRTGIEYADKGDSVTVLGESSKAYYVRYPLSRGGTKDRWVERSAVTAASNNTSIGSAIASAASSAVNAVQNNAASYQQWEGRAVRKSTAYKNAALTQKQGIEYVSAGDTVTVLNESGNAYYVRYPLTRGGTKDRWVSKNDIQRSSALVSGANNAVSAVISNGQYVWPVGGNGGTDQHNWPKYNTQNTYHSGTDISAPKGTEVYATCSGVIETMKVITTVQSSSGSYGRYMVIKCNVNNNIVYMYYAHLSGFCNGLKQGDTVQAGQLIGFVGNTGNTRPFGSGYHLHYEVRNSSKHYGNINNPTLNPYDYLPKR